MELTTRKTHILVTNLPVYLIGNGDFTLYTSALERFPDQTEMIKLLLQQDANFAEICSDYEELAVWLVDHSPEGSTSESSYVANRLLLKEMEMEYCRSDFTGNFSRSYLYSDYPTDGCCDIYNNLISSQKSCIANSISEIRKVTSAFLDELNDENYHLDK
jgi:hypothetical protein